MDELELVKPTKELKKEIEEYLQEFLDNGESEIAGDRGLDTIKNVDLWLEKLESNVIEEGRVPSTVYLTIRKSDNKIVGNVEVRHYLNQRLLNFGGHIGDSIRPSERRKGYATKQIKLALAKCKEFGIDYVLMECNKDNIGSAKSIQNNGGMFEKEVYFNDKLIQRYWISLKKRFATNPKNLKIVDDGSLVIRSFNNPDFTGDIALVKFNKMNKPYMIEEKNLCMANDNYKWLEFYDYNSNYKLTAMYNEKNENVEWYFDIARKIGKENGIPYEDDLYLDVVVTSKGDLEYLDEDELEDAFNRLEVSKDVYDMAHKKAKELINRLKDNKEKLKSFTDKYLEEMLQ